MVTEGVVELTAGADAWTWVVEDRDAEAIKRIYSELLRIEVQVEVFRRDGVQPVSPMLEHLGELDPNHFGSRLDLDFLAKELD